MAAAVLTSAVPDFRLNATAGEVGSEKNNAERALDNYVQRLASEKSSLANGDVTVPVIKANQIPFGMEDKALSFKGGTVDVRVNLTPFSGGPADGSYEFAFRTDELVSLNGLGFLARYVDEGHYAGMSIDGGTWQVHAAIGTGARQNTPLPNQFGKLEANTTYKVKMQFVGNQVSVFAMKEGDEDYTDLGTVALVEGVTTEGGSFAIRQNNINADIFLDNVVQYDADGKEIKTLDFNDGVVPEVEARKNKVNTLVSPGEIGIKEGFPAGEEVPGMPEGPVSKITATEDNLGVYVDTYSPAAAMNSMSVMLKGSAAKYGIAFNYVDDNNYATVEYDGTKWIAGGKKDGNAVNVDLSDKGIPAVKADDVHTYAVKYGADGYTFFIDDAEYKLGALKDICTLDGRIGVVVNEPMTLYAGAMEMSYGLQAVELPVPEEGVITLQSDAMQAVVGESFPHIFAYLDQDGNYLTGTGLFEEDAKNTGMTILTKDGSVKCETTSKLTKQEADKATYEITAKGEGIEAVFTVELKVVDNTLELNVTDVKEKEGTVRTFAFDKLPMVAVAGRGSGAALGFDNGWGPASDKFIDLKTASGDAAYESMTYALFYDTVSGVTAAVENNVEQGEAKYLVEQKAEYPYVSASNTAWAWQYYDNSNPTKNMPYAKVVVSGDENEDGAITWQDAGIAYRDIMKKAFGSENVKNEWMYIAMNMSSGASQPFLRVLDEAKAISYLTDGFGMKIMNKGYQGGGHDDSHGDYDFVGTQQGGVKDFNTLINEGLKYGIKNGVHINATEFALDGFETEAENLLYDANGELRKNWSWLDQAFLVDKTLDVKNGDLERRLDDFEEKVPNLDFFYVDVYQSGSNFNATEFIRYMNENGATVGTEALGDFNQQVTFVHWNTDMYYPSGGAQSEVLKFVNHGAADLAAPDKALLGSLMPGIADWRNVNDSYDAQKVFYRNNLPSKYLQHFELLDWTPNESAQLSDGVRTQVTEENGTPFTNIYKDGKLIAKLDTSSVIKYEDMSSGATPQSPKSSEIFIPWSPEVEDKIYCYNDVNAVQTWDVPDSWDGVSECYLYQLTEDGRADGKLVAVENGKVTLELEKSIPYILIKDENAVAHRYNADGSVMMKNSKPVLLPTTEEHEWGYGSAIENFGFSGKTFDGWTKSVEDGITIDTTLKGHDKSNPRVAFAEDVAGSISQTVKVKPGKTYSFSAWTMAKGDRSPKLTVKVGDVVKEASVVTTNGLPVMTKPSKYLNMDYQRLKVTVTVPEGVREATLTFSAEAGEQPVYVDDFRCWEWLTAPKADAKEYYYFENFENLDEGWGPFVSQVTNQPFIHLVYKNPEGGQMKYFTLDTYNEDGTLDETNLTSLKGRQSYAYTDGIMMRTVPSTLDFKQGAVYQFEMDYATFIEAMVPVDGHHAGDNYALDETMYYMDVRSADGKIIESYALNPSKLKGEGIGARPVTETLSFEVDATEESGIYLTLRRDLKVAPNDESPAFVLDNVRVKVVSPETPVVDKTAAQKYYDECLAYYVEDDYTEATWKVYADAMDALKAALEKEDVSEEELQEAVDAVATATEALVKKSAEPTDPVKPEEPDVPNKGDNNDGTPTTGDAVPVAGTMLLLLGSAMIILKRKKNEV